MTLSADGWMVIHDAPNDQWRVQHMAEVSEKDDSYFIGTEEECDIFVWIMRKPVLKRTAKDWRFIHYVDGKCMCMSCHPLRAWFIAYSGFWGALLVLLALLLVWSLAK